MRQSIIDPDQEHIFDLVKHGYNYLFRRASRKGHWEDARSTALAAICISNIERPGSHWFNAIRSWLLGVQIKSGEASGSWNEEIWDTAMCILALKGLGVSSKDPSIVEAANWIGSLFSVNRRGNWHDEPWETSWALIALLTCGNPPDSVDIEKPIEWLLSHLDDSGNLIASHYTAYMLYISHLSKKVKFSPQLRERLANAHEACGNNLVRSLASSPEECLWTGEAWANGQILWFLSKTGFFLKVEDFQLEKIVQWFSLNQTSDGNWSDVEDTACAILGLSELIVAKSAGAGSTRSSERLLEESLRRAVITPRLLTKRRLWERDDQTGYISLNIQENVLKVIVAVLAFILFTLLGWVSDVMSLLEKLHGHF